MYFNTGALFEKKNNIFDLSLYKLQYQGYMSIILSL